MQQTLRVTRPVAILAAMMTVIGCGTPPDDRLEKMAERSLDRQAQQNEVISEQSRAVTTTTRELLNSDGESRQQLLDLQKELVQAEAESREDLLAIQQDLVQRDAEGRKELDALRQQTETAIHGERQSIDRQREELESERKDIAQQRYRAPVIAAAITQVGLILACLAPLLLGAYVMYSLRRSASDDDDVTEVLVRELAAGPSSTFLPHHSPSDDARHELPGPSQRPSLEGPDDS